MNFCCYKVKINSDTHCIKIEHNLVYVTCQDKYA